jgi:AMMECR1 domain-containing protein
MDLQPSLYVKLTRPPLLSSNSYDNLFSPLSPDKPRKTSKKDSDHLLLLR